MSNWDVDVRCQLCLAAAGTLQHRRCCPTTQPDEGWGDPPEWLTGFVAQLQPQEALVLQTRALLAMRLSPPPRVPCAQLR